MSAALSAFLELLRIIVIVVLLGWLILGIVSLIYMSFDIYITDNIPVIIGTAIIIFTLYRNKFQFHGWYRGTLNKLSKRTTIILTVISILLLLSPLY